MTKMPSKPIEMEPEYSIDELKQLFLPGKETKVLFTCHHTTLHLDFLKNILNDMKNILNNMN